MASLETRKMTSHELAAALGMTKQQIYMLRRNGTGPQFLKIGRKVLYEAEVVESWIDSRRRSISDNSPAVPTKTRRLLQQAA